MRNKSNPMRVDNENPEWTAATFKKARTAKAIPPELIGPKVAEQMLRPRGRPKSSSPKQLVSLRLSPDVLRYFKSRGPGWQTRINETLRKSVAL